MKKKLLTICIPTYNRARFLSISLEQFLREFTTIDSSLVTLYVSDNNSSDNTEEIVRGFIRCGLPVVYHKNEANLGPDGNFIGCLNYSKNNSKYVWLLGDDDYIAEGRLAEILDILGRDNYGLLHLTIRRMASSQAVIKNSEEALIKIGVMISFMSSNIIQTSIIDKVDVTEELLKSNLLQVPFYVKSLLSINNVVLVNINGFFIDGFENAGIGGYNVFKVFIENYLRIINQFGDRGEISNKTAKILKRNLLWSYIIPRFVQTKIYHQYPRLKTDNCYRIIFRNYGYEWYFYPFLIKIPLILFRDKVLTPMRKP